jgi:hypothetical protein
MIHEVYVNRTIFRSLADKKTDALTVDACVHDCAKFTSYVKEKISVFHPFPRSLGE